jgi:hypothetical protein
MHVHTDPGTSIVFTGENGHGSESLVAQTFLVIGSLYTVKAVDVFNRWVQLVEWDDHWWNLDMFEAQDS